jgi:hypothetical protein
MRVVAVRLASVVDPDLCDDPTDVPAAHPVADDDIRTEDLTDKRQLGGCAERRSPG